MKAIIVNNNGSLSWDDYPTPTLKANEVLVRVRAAAVNRADLLQRIGKYPPPAGASQILGLELAGEVADANGHKKVHKGQQVMALVPGGAYAELAAIPVEMLLPIPEALTLEEAAAIPEALYTCFLNLRVEGQLKPNETVLVHAGAGGMGSTAIQLAKALGARVIATAGSREKIKFCKSLGADLALNYKEENLEARIKKFSGVDVIFDTVAGKDYAALHQKVLNPNGRWIVIGVLGGTQAEIDLSVVLRKNLLIKGSTLRNKPEGFKEELTRQIKRDILSLYETGTLRPLVDKTFSITRAEEAHNYIKANKATGKVVLLVES